MHELPDVEFVARYLDRTALHKKVVTGRVIDESFLSNGAITAVLLLRAFVDPLSNHADLRRCERRAVERHPSPYDALVTLKFEHEVAVVGVARFDAQKIRHLVARDIYEICTGIAHTEVQPFRRKGSEVASGQCTARVENVLLDARERGLESAVAVADDRIRVLACAQLRGQHDQYC